MSGENNRKGVWLGLLYGHGIDNWCYPGSKLPERIADAYVGSLGQNGCGLQLYTLLLQLRGGLHAHQFEN